MPGTEVGIAIYKPFIYEEKKYIYTPAGPSFHRVLWESRELNHTVVAASGLFC